MELDVQVDLYSDGKEDWLVTELFRRLRFPIRVVGGDPIPTGFLDGSYFLASDWKIQPYDSDQRLQSNGNFYSEDGTSPWLDTPGRTVTIEQNLSAIVGATFADEEIIIAAAALAVDTDVYFDSVNGVAGQEDTDGVSTNPVNNVNDALDLVASRGKAGVRIIEGTFALDRAIDNLTLSGAADIETSIVDLNGQTATRCAFSDVTLTGDANAQRVTARSSLITNLSDVHGVFEKCYLRDLTLDGGALATTFEGCRSNVAGGGKPVLDCNSRTGDVDFRGYHGGLQVLNLTSGAVNASFDLDTASFELAASCTDVASLVLRGEGIFTNSSSISLAKINSIGFINPLLVAAEVWRTDVGDAQFSDGTAGYALSSPGPYTGVSAITIDTSNGTAGTSHPIGTTRRPVDNLADAKTLAAKYGVNVFRLVGAFNIGATDDISNFVFEGANEMVSKITLTAGCTTTNTAFKGMEVIGVPNGTILCHNCTLTSISNVGSDLAPTLFSDCVLKAGTLTLRAGLTTPKSVSFVQCVSNQDAGFTLDMNGTDTPVGFRRFSGAITWSNYTGGQASVIGINQGTTTCDASCTTGTLEVSGMAEILDSSTGTFEVLRRGHVGLSNYTPVSFKSMEEVLFNALVAALNAGA